MLTKMIDSSYEVLMAYAIRSLIRLIFGAAIDVLFGALIVQHATKIVAKFKPRYGMACLATFLGNVASLIVGFLIGMIVDMTGNEFTGGPMVLTMIVGFFVQAAIYGPLIKSTEGIPIGFGKACMVNLIQLIICGLMLAIVLIVMAAAS